MRAVKTFVNKHQTLKGVFVTLLKWTAEFGLDLRKFIYAFSAAPYVLRDYSVFSRQNAKNDLGWDVMLNYPRLHDRFEQAGITQPQYFHQDYLVARKIFLNSPLKHVDVGSSIEGFVAHVAVFRQIEVFDIRPLTLSLSPNIVFRQCDFINPPGEFRNYSDSLSCLHALEHFGLGRYGDPIDINGHRKGFAGLAQVLKPGGTLYLSVPIGMHERVEFNAHRIFSIRTIMNLAEDEFEMLSFLYVDDSGKIHEDADLNTAVIDNSFGLDYGLGIFEFRKRI